MVLLRAYSSFSAAYGLKMNSRKSCAYFNGVRSRLKEEILNVSGFQEDTLPFKYLGVPVTAGRLKKKDCAVRIDKIVERIRSLGAKHLSYAGRLQNYSPPPDISWYWRKICQVRDHLAVGFVDNVWSISEDGYSVQSCYNWVRDKQADVIWSKAIWSQLVVPKHSFIAWLIAHNALMLKNRLFQYGVATDSLCCICHSQTEDLSHLFHECSFSKQVLQELGKWLCSDFTHAHTFVKIAS
ncbi:uncharacterized protein LOC141617220 [Silene latifolia]|uniref:uncharacterized protein LOC141617220 n=1 Tax=Silene latifolia TaxID=37657 RepID=UPI003D7717B0